MGDTIISEYTLEQAIADGVLIPIFADRWDQLSNGKPIVVTDHLFGEVSPAGLIEIWNKFSHWRQHVMPGLPEEDRMFSTVMNGKKIWVDENDSQITMMYPEDY